MGIIKKFTFDSVDSSTYGIGITGQAVYNAPERDVEMISIPGRDGEYALDRGRFSNIEVAYPAGMGDSDQTTFASRMSGLRNALCSRVGYKRLEDEYNPDEYRMAVYQRGLEVDPVHYSRAGEFEITFNCKPQRFLKSGETAVTVANNGTITNPTLFESHPLLAVKGYGTIGIGGQEIEVENVPIGEVILANSGNAKVGQSRLVQYDSSLLANGDTITCTARDLQFYLWNTVSPIASYTQNSVTGYPATINSSYDAPDRTVFYKMIYGAQTFTQGTPRDISTTVVFTVTLDNNSTKQITFFSEYKYDGVDTFTFNSTLTQFGGSRTTTGGTYSTIKGNSTLSALGNPLYIDLDIGECYKIVNGEPVSSNAGVQLTGNLPTLKPGSNTITYDNTVTELKITPRWWKI